MLLCPSAPKTLWNVVYTGAVLPAAVGRLLKHWKILDKAAGEGKGFLQTLQTLLRVQVSEGNSAAAQIGDEDSPCFGRRDGRSTTTSATNLSRDVDLCRWILSRSLSSQEAFSRPSLIGRGHARRLLKEPGTSNSSNRTFSRKRQPPPDEELTGRIIRAYRAFATAGLFGSGGSGDALDLAAGLWSTVLRLPEGLRPASEHRASLALRLAIDLGLPTISGTAGSTRSARTASGGGSGGGGSGDDSVAMSYSPTSARSGGGRGTGTTPLLHASEDAEPRHTASILAGLLDVHPVGKADIVGAYGGDDTKSSATGGRQAAGGATRGALFYRRFSEPIHEALLKRGGKFELVHSPSPPPPPCLTRGIGIGHLKRDRRRVKWPIFRFMASLS